MTQKGKIMSKQSEVNIKVALDENHIPHDIEWGATDTGEEQARKAKAMMLAMWDKEDETSMRMDLWTTEMTIDEMKRFYHQCYTSMAESFERATGEDGMGAAMRDFADFFGEKLQILPPSGKFDK